MSKISILNMFFNFDNSVFIFGKNTNIVENIIVNKNLKSYIIFIDYFLLAALI